MKSGLSNRSKFEIYRDIINALNVSSKSTYIMSTANVSSKQKEKYLRRMGKSGLIRRIEDSDIYEVTEKGKEFRKEVDGLLSLMR